MLAGKPIGPKEEVVIEQVSEQIYSGRFGIPGGRVAIINLRQLSISSSDDTQTPTGRKIGTVYGTKGSQRYSREKRLLRHCQGESTQWLTDREFHLR